VLGWVAQGATDAEIAAHLHLSTRTVEHHVAALLRKRGARSRRDLRAL
jgi:DNA-binding CsgD family transcriptional regulator